MMYKLKLIKRINGNPGGTVPFENKFGQFCKLNFFLGTPAFIKFCDNSGKENGEMLSTSAVMRFEDRRRENTLILNTKNSIYYFEVAHEN